MKKCIFPIFVVIVLDFLSILFFAAGLKNIDTKQKRLQEEMKQRLEKCERENATVLDIYVNGWGEDEELD